MKPGLLAAILAATMVASGAVAVLGPSALSPPFAPSHDSGSILDCENLVEGDRVELRNETAGERREIRIDADTRVRAEVRFERDDGSGTPREARIELCGIVQFVDGDGDGRLDSADTVVRTDLVRFGAIRHVAGEVHRFDVDSEEANMTVTIRVPDAMPPSDAPLVQWTIVADPDCQENATHFAVKVERDVPSSPDEFIASTCGTPLNASGDERSSTPGPSPPAGFNCGDSVGGTEFTFSLVERSGNRERRWEGRVAAGHRIRAEVRLDNGSRSGSGEASREARINLCGILQFADQDGDGRFGAGDATISRMLVPFGLLMHGLDGGFHTFGSRSDAGNLSITIHALATFPADDEALLRWSVEANPVCEPGATHFAVLVEHEVPAAADRFLVGECGRILSAIGTAG